MDITISRFDKSFITLFTALLMSSSLTMVNAQTFKVEKATDWNALFDRTTGWTGADGIYAIPLSGTDVYQGNLSGSTLFVFSDTFIGDVDSEGHRLSGSTLVNNTLAKLEGADADPNAIKFVYMHDDKGKPQAVFKPETPDSQPGEWYWLMDGVSVNDYVHVFGLRMKEGDGGVFNFAVAGVALLSAPVYSTTPLQDATQVDTPLFFNPEDGRGEIILGAAVMANTLQSGNPEPDGYIYVYGTQNDDFNKKLVAARVLADSFSDFRTWQYWDGNAWNSSIENIAPLTGRVSSELSVSPMLDGSGKYLLVFQKDTLSRQITIRIGDTPIGPWGKAIDIYTCPEPDLDKDIYTYNAKAHPHLSKPGELLISYNVNTFDFWDHFTYADIYRPRFIRIKMK